MEPTKPDLRFKIIYYAFVAELIIAGFLIGARDYMNELGAGLLFFMLPLLAAYAFILSAIYTIPILAISLLKSKRPQTKPSTILVWIAGGLNAIAAVLLTYGLIDLFIKVYNPGFLP